MKDKDKIQALGILALFAMSWMIVGFMFGFFAGNNVAQKRCGEISVSDTVYVNSIRVDTLVKTVVNVKTRYVKVPQFVYHTDTVTDTITVPLEYETRNYCKEGKYDITITGYDCVIDSALIYNTEHIRTVEKVVKEFQPQPFEFSLVGGVRYDFTEKQYFAGAEARINISRLSVAGETVMVYYNGDYAPCVAAKICYNLVKLNK